MIDDRICRGAVPQHILDQYHEADTHFMIHEDDPDLTPIKIKLPDPPKIEEIDGYGLPAKEQKFKIYNYPPRLQQLEDDVIRTLQAEESLNPRKKVTGQKVLKKTIEVINDRRYEYEDEIEWIYKQLYFIHYGYWTFINGKPTYIDPFYYFYLTFWKLDIGAPQYRDRDRRFHHFARYCYTTKEDENGVVTLFRTVLGFTYPKHRRDGATYKCLAILYHIAMTHASALCGIQSFNDDNAGEHFKEKLVKAWQKLPFFLSPMWSGTNEPAEELNFTLPRTDLYGDKLETRINYATTAHRSFYDGKKQYGHLSDENGKTTKEDVLKRHSVVRQTLAQGNNAIIHGFSMHPTTVSDMEGQGGQAFYDLCDQSKFYERNELGQTQSGLLRFFMPAYDGLEGFIGEYGESIIDTPTPEQAKFIGRTIGAKQHLQAQLDSLLQKNTPAAEETYRELVRLYPMSYYDCFRMSGGDSGFDVVSIENRIGALKRLPEKLNPVVNGDFYRMIDGRAVSAKQYVDDKYHERAKDGPVVFIPDSKGEGLFNLSRVLTREETNHKYKSRYVDHNGMFVEHWTPADDLRCVGCADPFQFLDPSQSRVANKTLSDGGGAVFWKRDFSVDPEDKAIQDWESHRFVCTYLYRHHLDDYYAEEMLMMCNYFNCFMYPERNVKLILKYFTARKYKGYLMHKVDKVTNQMDAVAGFHSLRESKEELFSKLRNHIKKHIHRECHMDLLIQLKDIKAMSQMTKYDLLTAAGGCLLAEDNPFGEIQGRLNNHSNQDINLYDIAVPVRR